MRNMRRFYVLSIQPTLFGGVSLVRHKVETFDDAGEADDALNRLERAKRRRGYRDPSSIERR